MTVSMHRASVPVLEQMLTSLDHVLDAVDRFAEEGGFDAVNILHMRLAPDMYPFTMQVQRAVHHSVNIAARLAEMEVPEYTDDENTVDGLKARVAKALDFLRAIPPAAMDGAEDRPVEFQIRIGTVRFTGQDCLFHYALPQVFFHVTTAYDIARHAGVRLGKVDFLGTGMDRRLA